MVVIIGGGITGASIAYYLNKLSSSGSSALYPVTIIDPVIGRKIGTNGTAISSAFCLEEDGASSKVGAGAFLSEAWGDRTKTENLHRYSFQMHAELATELGISSYQTIQAFKISDSEVGSNNEASTSIDMAAFNSNDDNVKARIPWLSGVASTHISGNAAQVDPAELTAKMLETSMERGAILRGGTVTGLDSGICDEEGSNKLRKVTGIHLEDGEIIKIPSNEDIVLAIGPWSSRMEDWLDIPMPIEGVSSTSLLWENCTYNSHANDERNEKGSRLNPVALFCDEDSNGCHLEILSRNDGSLYVSGCGGSNILSPAVIRANVIQPGKTNQPDEARAKAATKSVRALLSSSSSLPWSSVETKINGNSEDPASATEPLSAAKALPLSKLAVDVQNHEPKARSCIRPVSPDWTPIIGQVSSFQNVYVATGGGPWGITWAPVIGLSMASLLLDDSPPINLRNFSPRRFDTFVYKALQKERGKQANEISLGEQR